MRVLVTGGAGFIGSHYVRAVTSDQYPSVRGAEVTVLDKLTYAGNLRNLDPVIGNRRLSFVKGDICDEALLAEVVKGHDLVINFAAESHVDRSIEGASDFALANVVGTQALMQACLDASIPRVVQVSTDEVYGSIESGSWTEGVPLSPNSPYAAAKAGGDLMALAYARTHGLNVSITRSCNTYGPYQYPEKLIPLFITRALDGANVPLYGDGLNVRGWIYVDDHCRGIQLVADRGDIGSIYHINGDREISNLEMARLLLDACGASCNTMMYVPDRKGHDRRYSLDDSVLRAMGYAPQTPFDVGIASTVAWYAENRQWWEPHKSTASTRAPDRLAAGFPRVGGNVG